MLTVLPLDSHINPNITLAHALAHRGHEVAFYTGAEARTLVEQEGFQCFPFDKVDVSHVKRALDSIRELGWRNARLWREFLLSTIPAQVDDLRSLFRVWRPDGVVCDMALWGPILVLHEIESIPVAVFSHLGYCVLPGSEAPALSLGLPRPGNLAMKLVTRCVSKAASIAVSGVRRRANRIRQSYGLAPLTVSVTQFSGSMPLYLVPSTPELDYERRDLPPSVHYVGPCLWDKPSAQRARACVDKHSASDPRILVTEGTLSASASSIPQLAAQALEDAPHEVVIVMDKACTRAQLNLPRSAANIRVEEQAPLSDILPTARVVVTNGNSEIVLAALSRGIPLVVIPSILDQPEMAWRVVESGAGVRLPSNRCSPFRLRQAVERVMREPQFRQNAEKLAAHLSRRGGAQRAAELLENLATPA